MKFKNDYLCNFGDCKIELPSDEMFYLRHPKNMNKKITRFCSRKHLMAHVGNEFIHEDNEEKTTEKS